MKNIKKIYDYILNLIIPVRKDLQILQKLTPDTIHSLPRASQIATLSWITPLFQYKNSTVKAIVWELKYRGTTLPLETVGKLMYEEILAVISDITLFEAHATFLLLPIPISVERRVQRGYNQSEYIAKSILEYDTEHCLLYAPQWFEKICDTVPQSHTTSREERIDNLANCFQANPQVAEHYIFLVDDVVTTGTTLSEAKSTLISVGARDVYAFTIAH